MANPAYERGLLLLSRREHSRQELIEKLSLKGFDDREIAEAIVKLKENGSLSEDRYAEARCRFLIRRGYSFGFVRHDLQTKGIVRTISEIQVIFDDLGICPHEQARELAQKKLRALRGFIPLPGREEKIRKKLRQFLIHRGVPNDLIQRVFSEIFT